MPWVYFALTFVVGILTGFANFSKGSFFLSVRGQVLQGLLSLACFALIGWAFWRYGWKIGLLEVVVVFGGSNVGWSIWKRAAGRR